MSDESTREDEQSEEQLTDMEIEKEDADAVSGGMRSGEDGPEE